MSEEQVVQVLRMTNGKGLLCSSQDLSSVKCKETVYVTLERCGHTVLCPCHKVQDLKVAMPPDIATWIFC